MAARSLSVRRASLFNGLSTEAAAVDTVVTLTAADDANSSSKILSSSSVPWKRPTVLVASPSGEAARPLNNGGHSSSAVAVANGRPPPPQPRPRSPLRPASIFLPAARQGRRAGMLVGKQASFLPFLPFGRRAAAKSTGGSSGGSGGARAR